MNARLIMFILFFFFNGAIVSFRLSFFLSIAIMPISFAFILYCRSDYNGLSVAKAKNLSKSTEENNKNLKERDVKRVNEMGMVCRTLFQLARVTLPVRAHTLNDHSHNHHHSISFLK